MISPETARTHIQNALSKLGVHSRLEAAAFVTQNGLLEDLVGAASMSVRMRTGKPARKADVWLRRSDTENVVYDPDTAPST